MRRSHPIIQRLFFSDERILFFFAMYGFTAGIVFMIAASFGESNIANAAFAYNFPTVVVLLSNSNAFSGIAPVVSAAMVVMVSTGVWTIIASFFYGIFKMFKGARQMEDKQKRE